MVFVKYKLLVYGYKEMIWCKLFNVLVGYFIVSDDMDI